MKHPWLKLTVSAAMLAGSSAALAEISGSVALTSDYIFDGVSQTDNSAAVQVGIDYAHDSGFYAGAWASNVDFGGETNLETDLYAGFTFGSEAVSVDLGAVLYIYTETLSSPPSDEEADYYEIYGGITFAENFTVKAWFTDDYASAGVDAHRFKATYQAAVSDTWSIPLEYTFTDIDGEDFNHFRIGIAGNFEPFTVDLSYHQTDIDVPTGLDPDLFTADGLIVGTVTFSF